jgi:hypothetical protein
MTDIASTNSVQFDTKDVLPDEHGKPERRSQRQHDRTHDDERGNKASRDEQHDGEDQADRGNARDQQVVLRVRAHGFPVGGKRR